MVSRFHSFARIPFVRDVATLQLGRLVIIACGLLTSILYVRYLGLAGYGEYATIVAFAGTFGVLSNLGQQPTFLTFFAEAYGQKSRPKMQAVINYYWSLSAVVAALLFVLASLAPTLTTHIYGEAQLGQLARLIFVSSIFEIAFSYYSIVLQVVREIRLLTILENCKVVLQVALAIWLLSLGLGPAAILISYLAAAGVFCLITVIGLPKINRRYQLPPLKDCLSRPSWQNFWRYGRDGLAIAIDKNVGNLYPTVFIFALSTMAPKPVVGLLRLAFKLADLPTTFALSSISRMANSVLSTMAGQGATSLKNAFYRLTKHTILVHSLVTIAGMAIVPWLIPYVYGANFKVALYPYLVITGLQLVYGLHTCAIPVLRVYSRIYIATLFNVTAMAAALVTFYLLKHTLPVTQALYFSLAVYHGLVSLLIFPTIKLVRTHRL